MGIFSAKLELLDHFHVGSKAISEIARGGTQIEFFALKRAHDEALS